MLPFRHHAMTNVFISYRRDDAGGHAGRLADRLIARFGADRVFMDVQDIQPGQNFEQAIQQTLDGCHDVLVVIGPRWLQILQTRQAQGEDFVRHEVASALASGKTVIPVLVGGAKMPAGDALPAQLAALGRCQAVEVRDDRFDEDARALVAFLAGGDAVGGVHVLGRSVPRVAIVAAVATIAAVAAGAWLMWSSLAPSSARSSTPSLTASSEPPPLSPSAPSSVAPSQAPRVVRDAAVAPEPMLDGDWIGELAKPGQPTYRVRITLSRAGDTLIGMVRYPSGDGQILDGRYVNGRITFHTSHLPQFANEPATIQFQAQVEGDVLRLTTSDDAGVATGVARRAAATPPK